MKTQRAVVVLAFDEAQLLDIAGPLQVFATANDLMTASAPDSAPYRMAVASRTGGLIRTSSGLAIATKRLAAAGRGMLDTLIVAGGRGVRRAVEDRRLIASLRRRAPSIRRICSVCTGAFLLAEAGLLANRKATTHWKSCDLLKTQYPEVHVSSEPIYIQDGPVWTSAGITAGIDLALALVESDLGHRLAMDVARHLVVFLKRPGGQAQFSVPLGMQTASDDALAGLHAWIAGHLADDLRVEKLAARSHMSSRSFARFYRAQTGRTPARVVMEMRLEAARRDLEETALSVKEIAAMAGFNNDQVLRRAFQRRFGTPPGEYRGRFATRSKARSPHDPRTKLA